MLDVQGGLPVDYSLGEEAATMSEVGTKLDLARAYVDMGDPEGARAILDEVLQEGNAVAEAGSAATDGQPALTGRMARIAIGIEYDGSAYSGWQTQGHARSVQSELEARAVARRRHPVAIYRRGPHGRRACTRCPRSRTSTRRRTDRCRPGCSAAMPSLPGDISVLWARAVPDDFHARYSALSRSYVYRILNRADSTCTRSTDGCAGAGGPLDAGRMHAAAQALVGEHDFTSFRAAECQSRIAGPSAAERIAVSRAGEVVEIEVRANAFLQHMVRNIAGSLLAVGCGDRPPEWVAEVLAARDRTAAGVTAPPQGLYFAGVEYPSGFGLPSVRLRGAAPRSYAVTWFEKIMPSRDQDGAPHAIGAGGPVDQVPGVRRRAVSCGARAQPAGLPEVQPPHAHRRARPSAALPRSGHRPRTAHRRRAGGSAQVPRQQEVPRPPDGRAEGGRREGRADRDGRRTEGHRRGCLRLRVPVPRRIDGFGGRRALRARRRALPGAPRCRSSAFPRAAGPACRKACCRCCR